MKTKKKMTMTIMATMIVMMMIMRVMMIITMMRLPLSFCKQKPQNAS